MQLVILFGIAALIFLGPRRGGRPQRGIGLIAGIALLVFRDQFRSA